MHNLTEYSDNYSNRSGILWQCYRDVPVVNGNGAIVDFNVGNATTRQINIKVKLTSQQGHNGTKTVKVMVPLKYLSNFWRTLEMPFNCLRN